MPIDKYKRIQNRFSIGELYPDIKGKCSCGCGLNLSGRRTRWANDQCRRKAIDHYFTLKGDTSVIRRLLSQRDKKDLRNYCAICSIDVTYGDWQADHIIEVRHGGGGCELDNFQIVCPDCHKKKTKKNYNVEKSLSLFK